jgi:3-isopropylmalate/(R)-2-methylmalate dehydratase small subunit
MRDLKPVRGKTWKFGDNISTTDITPFELYWGKHRTMREIAFEAIRPGWKDEVKPGDCIVGGENFGFGSHRASANEVMVDLGIGCVVADSIARIFYRNAISMGFLAFPCPGVSRIFEEGDNLELDAKRGIVTNLTTGENIQGKPYPDELLNILRAGGLMPLLRERVKKESSP